MTIHIIHTIMIIFIYNRSFKIYEKTTRNGIYIFI